MCNHKSLISRLLLFFITSLFYLGTSAQADSSKQGPFANAIYMIDDKEVTKEQVGKLDKNTIKSVNVWKGDKAIEKFGDKGKNGVVVITTGPPTVRPSTPDSSKKPYGDYDHVFIKVEHPATFPGGEDGWKKICK